MRPLSRNNGKRFRTQKIVASAILTAGACTSGCSFGNIQSQPPPPPPPLSIVVAVSPPTGSVLLGNQVTLTATVSNTTDTAVIWSVNGVTGGNTTVGTITAAGVYTAPIDLPVPATVQITATSHADASKSGRAALTVTSDITLKHGAEFRKRGTRRRAGFFRHRDEQCPSGWHCPLEPLGPGLRERMRNGGCERELHRAEDSSLPCERNADRAKRCRPFETSFHGGGHHQ